CVGCGAVNSHGSRFCNGCGKGIICNRCGDRAQSGARFCAQCGNTL
ncbi:zinc-ribbon domain-containing protein, partial [Ralstonia mannitolilytica]